MRAATAIVGAIAAASVLIALSLIVSGGSSGQTVVTKRVVETVEAPAVREETSEPGAAEENDAARFGGPAQCSNDVSVENVSCEVGEQVHLDYEKGHRGDFFPEEDGKTIEMICTGESPVECTDAEGAVVYFGP
jgi:hypothetical protein